MSKSCFGHSICRIVRLFYLQTVNGNVLKAHFNADVLGDLHHQTLEGELGKKQFAGLLVLADVTKGHDSRTVSNGLFHATSQWGRFASRFGGYCQQK